MEYVLEIVFILRSMKLSRDNGVNDRFVAPNSLTTCIERLFFLGPGYNNGDGFGPLYDSCVCPTMQV